MYPALSPYFILQKNFICCPPPQPPSSFTPSSVYATFIRSLRGQSCFCESVVFSVTVQCATTKKPSKKIIDITLHYLIKRSTSCKSKFYTVPCRHSRKIHEFIIFYQNSLFSVIVLVNSSIQFSSKHQNNRFVPEQNLHKPLIEYAQYKVPDVLVIFSRQGPMVQ